MTALPHLCMYTIFPVLEIVAFSLKACLCSPTNLLKFYLIPSHKTVLAGLCLSEYLFPHMLRAWHLVSPSALSCSRLFFLFTKTILKSCPIQQLASDSLSFVSPANLIISVSTSSQVHNEAPVACVSGYFSNSLCTHRKVFSLKLDDLHEWFPIMF